MDHPGDRLHQRALKSRTHHRTGGSGSNSRLEAIASRLEAIATRLEAIASRLEAIASRLEAIAVRFLKVCFFNIMGIGDLAHPDLPDLSTFVSERKTHIFYRDTLTPNCGVFGYALQTNVPFFTRSSEIPNLVLYSISWTCACTSWTSPKLLCRESNPENSI